MCLVSAVGPRMRRAGRRVAAPSPRMRSGAIQTRAPHGRKAGHFAVGRVIITTDWVF